MAIRSLDKRLALLENKDRGNSGIVAVWREIGESDEQAIARRFDGKPPANTKFYVFRWKDDSAEFWSVE